MIPQPSQSQQSAHVDPTSPVRDGRNMRADLSPSRSRFLGGCTVRCTVCNKVVCCIFVIPGLRSSYFYLLRCASTWSRGCFEFSPPPRHAFTLTFISSRPRQISRPSSEAVGVKSAIVRRMYVHVTLHLYSRLPMEVLNIVLA